MYRPDDQIGPYVLIRELGRGAFGIVWLAEKRSRFATIQVALKFSLASEVDMTAFEREAQVWSKASGHPNVIPVIEADIHDGQLLIASEYASGGTLESKVFQHGQGLDWKSAVRMVSGIVAGLSHLHGVGIVHRDLKPANILLQAGIPRLTDFGISSLLRTTRSTRSARGTPAYMSPESWNGKCSVQADIWSVGVILYEMLTGTLPFPQEDYWPLFLAIMNSPTPALPKTVPDWLQAVVMKALQKSPEQRYQSVTEMATELENRSDARSVQVDRPVVEPATGRRTTDRELLDNLRAMMEVRASTAPVLKSGSETTPAPAAVEPRDDQDQWLVQELRKRFDGG